MHPVARLFVPWYWGIGPASRSHYPKGSSQRPGGVVAPGVAFSLLDRCRLARSLRYRIPPPHFLAAVRFDQ